MKNPPRLTMLALILALCSGPAFGAESTPASAPPAKSEDTNSLEMLRAYLQVQEQLHATQLAIERNRKESDEAAARNAQALAGRLQSIEQSLGTQRARELESMQSSNRVMLIVAGTFAMVGLGAMLLMAYFQWRTVNQLAQISNDMSATRALGPGPSVAALGPGDARLVSVSPPEGLNQPLLGALERLEKRIHELEHTSHPPLPDGSPANHEQKTAPAADAHAEADANGAPDAANGADAARITVLLGKGQSLLNVDDAEHALVCFDEVLGLDANNTEALVKKGAALERLRKMSEAIECYDRAIAADGSMTIAYLYKGGLFNRMERFSEALECYEQALRAQEKRRA